jgi:hypothetical protein
LIAANLNLASNLFYRELPALVIPVAEQGLVDMQELDVVRDLREAA